MNTLETITTVIIGFCAGVIFLAILLNFAQSEENKIVRQNKSIVETGSMTIFYLIYYFVLRLNVSRIYLNPEIHIPCVIIGLLMIISGTAVNIAGRIRLGSNWANQIVIYKEQTLVTEGVYSIVRHPLYASLIWIFYGGSLIFLNPAGFLLNALIFTPFMHHRAVLEEKQLEFKFSEYSSYRENCGMFFPKLFRRN